MKQMKGRGRIIYIPDSICSVRERRRVESASETKEVTWALTYPFDSYLGTEQGGRRFDE
ncbi:hypothetical protein [Paenibacillus sp. JNUCC31]|uniref:hypothetical protein n=1 Tax=Paenibacillus sp. JNUCC-31 TaxID=2777983 RepID=UPI001E4BAC65|nr:hypothetical protein [Paenibacillus sp. JNUCC-31]